MPLENLSSKPRIYYLGKLVFKEGEPITTGTINSKLMLDHKIQANPKEFSVVLVIDYLNELKNSQIYSYENNEWNLVI